MADLSKLGHEDIDGHPLQTFGDYCVHCQDGADPGLCPDRVSKALDEQDARLAAMLNDEQDQQERQYAVAYAREQRLKRLG
jgi:hypothetical protein